MARSPTLQSTRSQVAILLYLSRRYTDHQGRPPSMDLPLSSRKQLDTGLEWRLHDPHRSLYTRLRYDWARPARSEAQTLYDFI